MSLMMTTIALVSVFTFWVIVCFIPGHYADRIGEVHDDPFDLSDKFMLAICTLSSLLTVIVNSAIIYGIHQVQQDFIIQIGVFCLFLPGMVYSARSFIQVIGSIQLFFSFRR